jgi:ABC-type amino acid transport substrate-binding protein
MEEIGKRSMLKVEWAEEVGYESIFPGLNSGRVDIFAGGLWPNSSRARSGLFSEPLFFSVITAWGRIDEQRFSNNLTGVDSSTVRIASIDGAMEDAIAKNDFPKAERISLPQLSPFSQNLLNITNGKADLTFAEPSVIAEFSKANPGKLKELGRGTPLRIFGNTLVVGSNNWRLKQFLDVAVRELIYDGTVDKVLKKYEINDSSFRRVNIPYQ